MGVLATRRAARLAGLASLALTACSFSGGSGGGGPDAGVDGGDGDGGGIDAPVQEIRCGSPGAFIDDLSDGERWFPIGPGDVAAFDGSDVTLTADTSVQGQASGVSSLFAVDARDAVISAEVVAPLSLNDSAAGLFLGDSAANVAGFSFAGDGSMSISTRFGDGMLESTLVPGFVASTDRFFRFAGSGTTLSFSISADRVTWTEVHAVTDANVPTLLSAAFVRLLAVAISPAGVGSTIAFDNINTTEADVAPWCKSAALTDDFGDDLVAVHWFPIRSADCGPLPETAGAANFDQVANPAGRTICLHLSSAAVDLRESEAVIEVPTAITAPAEWAAVLSVETASGVSVALVHVNGQLCTVAQDGLGTDLSALEACVDDDPTVAFWRVSMDAGGLLTFDISADAATWTPVLDGGDPPFDGSEVEIGFGTTSSSLGQAVTFAVEAFNP